MAPSFQPCFVNNSMYFWHRTHGCVCQLYIKENFGGGGGAVRRWSRHCVIVDTTSRALSTRIPRVA